MSSQAHTDEEAFERVCRELIERIISGDVTNETLESVKLEVCGEFSSPRVPKNTELLARAPTEQRDDVIDVLQRKPVRTASGVSPVAIMTSPHMCPHGRCLYCPGGPASEFSSAQSYTGFEPAAARGKKVQYDPYKQVTVRLSQLHKIGHPTDKAELILMGGTMTARSHDYQEWFVKRAVQAMNEFDPPTGASHSPESTLNTVSDQFRYLEDVITTNETAQVRCVGITFETKPDWCGHEQIDRMLSLGGTKVELGVQTTHDHINRAMHRGHGSAAAMNATQYLRDAAFKVGYHMMPGQPGMTSEMCLDDFEELFSDPAWRPDYLKIYPTLVVRGTRLYDMWRQDEFEPLTNEEATDLIADIKARLPRYVRLQRVQRDIPADFIDAGVWKSNLRQLAKDRLTENGGSCACIRCREVGLSEQTPENIEFDVLTYDAAGGTEHFLSFEDFDQNLLVGFCRVRFPNAPVRRELQNAALVRELHVYGSEVGVGQASTDWQHQGYGQRLMNEAEQLAIEAGYEKVSVISGIGAREYYREKLGYHQDGPYLSKEL